MGVYLKLSAQLTAPQHHMAFWIFLYSIALPLHGAKMSTFDLKEKLKQIWSEERGFLARPQLLRKLWSMPTCSRMEWRWASHSWIKWWRQSTLCQTSSTGPMNKRPTPSPTSISVPLINVQVRQVRQFCFYPEKFKRKFIWNVYIRENFNSPHEITEFLEQLFRLWYMSVSSRVLGHLEASCPHHYCCYHYWLSVICK